MKDDDEIRLLVEPFSFAEAAQAAQGLTAEDLCARSPANLEPGSRRPPGSDPGPW